MIGPHQQRSWGGGDVQASSAVGGMGTAHRAPGAPGRQSSPAAHRAIAATEPLLLAGPRWCCRGRGGRYCGGRGYPRQRSRWRSIQGSLLREQEYGGDPHYQPQHYPRRLGSERRVHGSGSGGGLGAKRGYWVARSIGTKRACWFHGFFGTEWGCWIHRSFGAERAFWTFWSFWATRTEQRGDNRRRGYDTRQQRHFRRIVWGRGRRPQQASRVWGGIQAARPGGFTQQHRQPGVHPSAERQPHGAYLHDCRPCFEQLQR